MKQNRKAATTTGRTKRNATTDDLQSRVRAAFAHNIELVESSLEPLTPLIVAVAMMMVKALVSGRKILLCGNGGSAACAQLFSSHLLNRYTYERPGLPAIALRLR